MHFLVKIFSVLWQSRNTIFFLIVILPLCTFLYFSNQQHKFGASIVLENYSINNFDATKFKASSTDVKVKNNKIKVTVFSSNPVDASNIVESVNNDIVSDLSYGILSDLQKKLKKSSNKMQSLQLKKETLLAKLKKSKVSNSKKELAKEQIKIIESISTAESRSYKQLLNRLESFDPENYIKVLDKKPLPNQIFWFKILISFFASLGLGVFIAALKSKLNGAFINRDEIKKEIKVKTLDGLAKFRHLDYIDNQLVANKLKLSNLTEIARIFKYISGKDKKVIGVLSSIRGEGNSSLAYALAEHASNNKNKTLLIDMDLRAKGLSMAKELSLNWNLGNEKGLSDLKDKTITLRDNLEFLPALKDEQTLNLLKSTKELKQLFDYLKKEYDYIFIDTSAIMSANVNNIDSLVLASVVDGVVVNYLLNKTPKNTLRYSIEKLNMFGAKTIAIVTNHKHITRMKDDLLGFCDFLEKINKKLAYKLKDKILKSDILDEK